MKNRVIYKKYKSFSKKYLDPEWANNSFLKNYLKPEQEKLFKYVYKKIFKAGIGQPNSIQYLKF